MPWELDREFDEQQRSTLPHVQSPSSFTWHHLIWLLMGIIIGAAATFMLYPEQTRLSVNQQQSNIQSPIANQVVQLPPHPADTLPQSIPRLYSVVNDSEALFVLPVPDDESGYQWTIRVHPAIPPSHIWYEIRSTLTPVPASRLRAVPPKAMASSTQVQVWRVDDAGQSERLPVDAVARVRGDAVVIVVRGHDIVQEIFATKPSDLCFSTTTSNTGATLVVGGIAITYFGDNLPVPRSSDQPSYC